MQVQTDIAFVDLFDALADTEDSNELTGFWGELVESLQEGALFDATIDALAGHADKDDVAAELRRLAASIENS